MKFFDKRYFFVWILTILIVFLFSINSFTSCRDGLILDEEKILEGCGVTGKEYLEKIETDKSFCPKIKTPFKSTGGCGPIWNISIINILIASALYNLIYLASYFHRKK